MKALKWTAGIACALLAVFVLAVLSLGPAVQKRQASMKPLDRETLVTLGIMAPDEEDAAPASDVSEAPSAAASTEDAAAAQDSESGAESKGLSRLAGRPTEGDFVGGYSSLWDRAFTRVYLPALKSTESAFWMIGPDSGGGFEQEIGHESYQMGDHEAAKMYLSEALRLEKRERRREHICGMLAWVEEDPEIAAALLRESCASDNRHRLHNAMALAILTESDDLAEHYFERWTGVLEPGELENWFKLVSRWPEVEAFLERKAGEAD